MTIDTVQEPESDQLSIASQGEAPPSSFDAEEIDIIALRLWQRGSCLERLATNAVSAREKPNDASPFASKRAFRSDAERQFGSRGTRVADLPENTSARPQRTQVPAVLYPRQTLPFFTLNVRKCL